MSNSFLKENEELRTENSMLKARVAELRRELQRRQEDLDFFELHPTLATGNKGEIIISRAVNGKLTPNNTGHDIDVRHYNLKIEVKTSNPSPVNDKNHTLRWIWNNVTGQTGKKQFDRLILIGIKIEAFSHQYKDESNPRAFYDIPFCSIDSVAYNKKNGSKMIILPVNWDSVKGEKAKCCQTFETTLAELGERYGL